MRFLLDTTILIALARGKLAECAVENLRLVTIDRALSAHQLSWRPA
jgi:hypothetical protein